MKYTFFLKDESIHEVEADTLHLNNQTRKSADGFQPIMNQMEKLMNNGRNQFDLLQKNLSEVTSATDEQLQPRLAERNDMASMFGGDAGKALDAEAWREESRNTQDKLDRQGREGFAKEYAETQIKNLAI